MRLIILALLILLSSTSISSANSSYCHSNYYQPNSTYYETPTERSLKSIIRNCSKFISNRRNSRRARGRAYYHRGLAYFELNNSKAITDLRKAVKLHNSYAYKKELKKAEDKFNSDEKMLSRMLSQYNHSNYLTDNNSDREVVVSSELKYKNSDEDKNRKTVVTTELRYKNTSEAKTFESENTEKLKYSKNVEKKVTKVKKTKVANSIPKKQAIIRTGKRIALIIGNDNYSNLPHHYQLQKARNDARATAETFSNLGFNVTSGFDLKRRNMNIKLTKFSNKIEPGDEVMFFFAGHGIRIDGQNYLLPSDIPKISDVNEDLLKAESLRVDFISDMFRKKGARLSLLVLDACRNNPYKDNRGRSIGGTRGLAPMDPPEGTLVLYSAGAGQEALDRLSNDDSDPNSVFTRIFLPLVKQEGLELSRLSRLIKGKVRNLARSVGHLQTPAVYNEVIGDVFLVQ